MKRWAGRTRYQSAATNTCSVEWDSRTRQQVLRCPTGDPRQLERLHSLFFDDQPPEIAEFRKAVRSSGPIYRGAELPPRLDGLEADHNLHLTELLRAHRRYHQHRSQDPEPGGVHRYFAEG